MDIANLFLRACNNNGAIYLPYAFEGDWTDEEKQVISTAIDPHVPERVDAMFNNWMFWKHNWGFSAKKATWEMIWSADTVEEMAGKITGYYLR